MFNSLKNANRCQNDKALWKEFALSRDWMVRWEVKSSSNMYEVRHVQNCEMFTHVICLEKYNGTKLSCYYPKERIS